MKILIALGGNAILQNRGKGTSAEQFAKVGKTSRQLVKILQSGHRIAVTHGNGPQVGDILLANEMAKDVIPPMPLDVCGAETQGMIGYMIQQSLQNELKSARMDTRVVTVVTQTVVDRMDPAFSIPTKPIGPYYSGQEAELLKEKKNWTLVNDSNKGYRRVVPSPDPVSIVEEDLIGRLFNDGVIVVAAGGGGIPVARDAGTGKLEGVEAVIDKDLAASLMARALEMQILLILTDVEGVSLDYGKPSQRPIERMSVHEARRYLREGQFPAGSMGPKVEASVRFVESGGEKALITSLGRAGAALEGKAGTAVTLD